MKRILATLVASSFLVACEASQNPFRGTGTVGSGTGGGVTNPGTGTPTTPTASGIPASLAGTVTQMAYDAGAGTLTVFGVPFDNGQSGGAVYVRNAGLDRPGYLAFSIQDDPLDRHFTAFTAQDRNEGVVRAAIVMSGGLNNEVYGGGFYERDGAYTPPNDGTLAANPAGEVSYAGNYIGLSNYAGDRGDALPVPAGTPSEQIPLQAAEVTGTIFLNADFGDGVISGGINDRMIDDGTGTLVAMPSLALLQANIAADGTFFGDIQHDGNTTVDTGDWGGIFGGTDAQGVAGVVNVTAITDPQASGEFEYGVFVLEQCGQPVDAGAACTGVNP